VIENFCSYIFWTANIGDIYLNVGTGGGKNCELGQLIPPFNFGTNVGMPWPKNC
jgi:hypothetical protein